MFKVLLFSMLALAAREEKAHVHGMAKAAMAFEGKTGKIEMSLPSSGIYGFEYIAKSAKDKKAKDAGLQKLEDKVAEMFVFDPSLKCEIKKEAFEVDQRENHSDIDAEFHVNCEKSPVGTTVMINVSKIFPRIKTVQVDVIAEGVQKSQEVKKSGEGIELK